MFVSDGWYAVKVEVSKQEILWNIHFTEKMLFWEILNLLVKPKPGHTDLALQLLGCCSEAALVQLPAWLISDKFLWYKPQHSYCFQNMQNPTHHRYLNSLLSVYTFYQGNNAALDLVPSLVLLISFPSVLNKKSSSQCLIIFCTSSSALGEWRISCLMSATQRVLSVPSWPTCWKVRIQAEDQ